MTLFAFILSCMVGFALFTVGWGVGARLEAMATVAKLKRRGWTHRMAEALAAEPWR